MYVGIEGERGGGGARGRWEGVGRWVVRGRGAVEEAVLSEWHTLGGRGG